MEHTTAATAASKRPAELCSAPRTYLIEKNVPMPSGGGGKRGVALNTLREMILGDSFEVPKEEVKGAQNAILKLHRETAMRFTCLKQANGNYRVWCVEVAA